MKKHAICFIIIAVLMPFISFSQNKIYEPARGSEERKLQMDVLRNEFTPAFNGQKLIFEVTGNFYKSNGNWVFIYVNVYQQGGKPVDFNNSKYKKEYEEEMIDSNGIFALLKKINNKWALVTHIDFPTDVPVGCWWKEYNVPKNLFGSAAQDATDCEAQ
ncbi:MAG: hypothetical protein H7122_05005 [Chitinophagaceae bacterium]|nr:hypothetical protein [Chitinophagaceae bacterium]